jgi:hypothetical protein
VPSCLASSRGTEVCVVVAVLLCLQTRRNRWPAPGRPRFPRTEPLVSLFAASTPDTFHPGAIPRTLQVILLSTVNMLEGRAGLPALLARRMGESKVAALMTDTAASDQSTPLSLLAKRSRRQGEDPMLPSNLPMTLRRRNPRSDLHKSCCLVSCVTNH